MSSKSSMMQRGVSNRILRIYIGTVSNDLFDGFNVSNFGNFK